MDVKLEKLITENMKSIFGFALTRVRNVPETEYLASDILYRLICSAEKLKDENCFYGFMWKIAENTYVDYLRKKSNEVKRTVELEDNTADDSESISEEIFKQDELNLLRRELSLLSKQYRDVSVLHYIENFSCSEIAKKMNISVEMVKYFLFRARKIIREGMNMERSYGEKSYHPNIFEIDFWGTKAGDDLEYRDFETRKIKGNILLAAYYVPMTIQEISMELGVSLPYLEDEINLLVDRQYLVCSNGKYITNIPIFTSDCTEEINWKIKEITKSYAEKLIAVTDEFSDRFGERFENENLARWQKVVLSLHFALMNTNKDLGALPSTGPYSLVNGGGGKGIIWGRSKESIANDDVPSGIQGIYNSVPSSDGKGSVIAMNFRQTLNAQQFEPNMTNPVVCTAVDSFEYLSDYWKKQMETFGYTNNGKANFAVWSAEEYSEMKKVLCDCIDILTELTRKTSNIAAAVTADLAPKHIRQTAEYVGAFVYRFNSAESIVNALYNMKWLKDVGEREKPALCVVKS